jgi:hypothetical protein
MGNCAPQCAAVPPSPWPASHDVLPNMPLLSHVRLVSIACTHLCPVCGNMKDSLFRKDPYWTQGVEFNLRHFSTIWSCGKLQCAILDDRRHEPRLFILKKSVHVIRLLNSLIDYELPRTFVQVRKIDPVC